MQLSTVPRGMTRFLSSALLALIPLIPFCRANAQSYSSKPIVFLIVLENKNSVGWGGVYGTTFWVDPEAKLSVVAFGNVAGQAFGDDFEQAIYGT